jgi:hypothetical protein
MKVIPVCRFITTFVREQEAPGEKRPAEAGELLLKEIMGGWRWCRMQAGPDGKIIFGFFIR